MKNVKKKTVCSATKKYVWTGILFAILIIALEIAGIYQLFVSPLKESLPLIVLVQLPAAICLLFSYSYIAAWKNKQEFIIYYSSLSRDTDLDEIIDKYEIMDISPSHIVFVDKENSNSFCDWKISNNVESLFCEN